jgi:putative sterol carrier protein
MTDSATAFFTNVLPPHFAKGVEALRAKTGPGAKEALDDVLASKGAIRLVIEGEGETWLVVDDGAMRAEKERPDGYTVRMAFGFTAEAAKAAVALLEESGRMDEPEAPARFARSASARAEKLLANQKIELHVIIKDLPDDAEDVVIKVGIGTDTPPEKPQFTAAISYDDLEDMREGDITPQQVLGRLRLTGDASRAMALGMMLMQPPAKK